MEEICKALSDKLGEGGANVYRVFYGDELTEALPEGFRSAEHLESALKRLKDGGYIDVKYARGAAFCIALLHPYELPREQPEPALPQAKPERRIPIKTYALIFFAAFIGAVAGALTGAFL